jgi:hypothetical protein
MTARMFPPELATRPPIIVASDVSSSVGSWARSSWAMISLSSGLIDRCSLCQERRVSPCLALAHSPAPKNFNPLLSMTMSTGPSYDWRWSWTTTVRRRRAKCRMIRQDEIKFHQLHQRAHEAFALARRQMQHRTQHQCRFAGHIGETALPARCRPACNPPANNRML